ncbi:MAG: hypothetical protein SVM79_04770 [Chloroflexota bacterium]|nr:hypothetical protein [Chloroflexota bacterium]
MKLISNRQNLALTLKHLTGKGEIIFREERGMGLAESLVAVALLGTAIIALTVALSTGSLAVNATGQEVTTQNLARSQMAYTKSYPYNSSATTYPSVATFDATYNPNPLALPDGCSITVEASATADSNSNIQKIITTINQDKGSTLIIEDFKVNR